MQFDLMHIWDNMGLVSRLVAFSLVLMAVLVIGVVVERLLDWTEQAGLLSCQGAG